MKHWLLMMALVGSGWAQAHDTWFEPLSRIARGEVAVALGTGDKFPQHDVPIGPELIQSQGCLRGVNGPQNTASRLRHLRSEERSASYRAATGAAAAEAITCWMQMHPIELQVTDDKADLYLKEIGATPELRAQWGAMRARGVGWHERYVKSARIEWAAGEGALATQAAGLPMDVVMSAPRQPVQAGDAVTFQVLRDGAPLPNQPIEFVNDLNPLGLWRRTDAKGRITLPLPLAAKWMLRGTDLRVSPSNPDFWESRFVTLTLEVSSPK
jgi:uncharacterized GH25 family protein